MAADAETMPLDLTDHQLQALRVAVGWRFMNLQLERDVSPERVNGTVFETTRMLVLDRAVEVTEYQANVILGCLFARVEFLNLELCINGSPGMRHALESEAETLCGIVERMCTHYFDAFKMRATEETGGIALPKSIWPLMSNGTIHHDWAALGG